MEDSSKKNERLVWHILVTAMLATFASIQKWKSFELADSKKIYPIRTFTREIAAAIPWKSRGVIQADFFPSGGEGTGD